MTEHRGPPSAWEPQRAEGVSIVVPTYCEVGNLRPLARTPSGG